MAERCILPTPAYVCSDISSPLVTVRSNDDNATDANYLLKCLQGYQSKGFSIWAISIQVCISTSAAQVLRSRMLTYRTVSPL